MERDKIKRLIVQISTYEKGTIPFMCACDQLLAEFDRLTEQRDAYREETEGLRVDKVALKAENERLEQWLVETNELAIKGMEALDKICKPMIEWRQGKADIADAIELTNQVIASYLDSQKPSEKHNPSNEDEGTHEGNWRDCPICNQKHLCNDGIWEYIPKSECQRCNPPKCEHKNKKAE